MTRTHRQNQYKKEAQRLLHSAFNIDGSLTLLPGENCNYFVTASDGRKYVFKIIKDRNSRNDIELEHAGVSYVASSDLNLTVPLEVSTPSGLFSINWEGGDGRKYLGRLFHYVDGKSWGEVDPPPGEDLLYSFGQKLGKLDRALVEFSHPRAKRTHAWDLSRAGQHQQSIPLVPSTARRRILESCFHLWRACALPRFAELPHSYIHGDANDENVLIKNGMITGLLDFGDSLWNPTICELAIAAAYAILERQKPLEDGSHLVAGYHAERALSSIELQVLFPLICGRLAVTATTAAERRLVNPNHPTWYSTENRAWKTLEILAEIDPADAADILGTRIDLDPYPDRGTPPEVLLEARERSIGTALSIAYRKPLKMIRGEGQTLHDYSGRPYLDLVNNVCHVGHCHPRVVEAGRRQMGRLNTNTRYLYDGLTEYADRLTSTLPAPLTVCFFVNSGSEANELALRIARAHTGRQAIAVLEGAYHGHTGGLIAISPYKFMGPGGRGEPEPWVHVAPMPNGYRGMHRGQGRETGVAYGNDVGRIASESNEGLAAFIAESLISCGGQIIPPEGYFETAYRHVREVGGLCIADEVQVGFGRVGTHFWAFETQNVIPDIVVMGKPIGNGHPLSAVVTTKEIAASFANGMEFFSTFGGNPVSCAIGLAVLNVVKDEKLQDHALHIGRRMLDGFRDLAERHPIIGDVRGAGLFIGVELVRDRKTLEPATEEAGDLINRMRGRGVLLSTDGPYNNVLKIKPPMVLSADDVDMVIRMMDDELPELEDKSD